MLDLAHPEKGKSGTSMVWHTFCVRSWATVHTLCSDHRDSAQHKEMNTVKGKTSSRDIKV